MGLFGRGDGKQRDSRRGGTGQLPADPGLGEAYLEALSRCMGIAQLRQKRFADWLGKRSWNVDFSAGRIAFEGPSFPIAFLGTQSEAEGSWLWGADNVNGFPEPVVRDVTEFFYGPTVRALPGVCNKSFPVKRLMDGHALACLFVGGQPEQRYAYYRCPYDGGAAFVAVKELPDAVFAPAGGIELLEVLRELVGAAPLHHRVLVESLLREHCAAVTLLQDGLRGELHDGARITVGFDDNGRIATMNASAAGQ